LLPLVKKCRKGAPKGIDNRAQGNALGIEVGKFSPALKGRDTQTRMPQSLAKIIVHLVYSTKNRERVLTEQIRDELHRYTGGILRELGSPALLINSVEDHVHIVFSLTRTRTISEIVEAVKIGTSKWLKTKGSEFSQFHWQSGYGVFSVSQSNLDDVLKYVANQPEHHRRKTFQEEYRELLKRYQIEYDEKYVWD
jgi:putative transposase